MQFNKSDIFMFRFPFVTNVLDTMYVHLSVVHDDLKERSEIKKKNKKERLIIVVKSTE